MGWIIVSGAFIVKKKLRGNHGLRLISTIPALMGWSALIFVTSLFYSLIIIILAFIIALAHDYYLHNTKAAPYWFMNIRVPLTSVVIILSFIMFFYIG